MKIDHLLSALRLYERRTPADPPPVTNRRAPPRWRTSRVAYRCAEAAGRAHSHLTPLPPSSTSSQPPVPTPDEPKTGFLKKMEMFHRPARGSAPENAGLCRAPKCVKFGLGDILQDELIIFIFAYSTREKRRGTEGISWAPKKKTKAKKQKNKPKTPSPVQV